MVNILKDEQPSIDVFDQTNELILKADQPENMPYRVVTIQERDLWNQYVHSCRMYDFYHTWYYHSLEKSGKPILFVYQRQDFFIVFPLLKRDINGTGYSDFTSVYGYAGPISNFDFKEMDHEAMEGFKQTFLQFLKDEKNVSIFCRLHPIINHDILVEKFGSLVNNGNTISIDLTVSLEEQRSKYRRQFRAKSRQLREKGFYLKRAESNEEVQEFVKIYNENMARVKAETYYHFDESYFFTMLNSADFGSSVLLLYFGNEIASGAFVTFSNDIMQFHLAATNNKYLKEGPMKLLIDEASKVGRKNNMKFLHLGGGVGGNEDSLFEFKAGFSDTVLSFKTWRYISDQKAYDELVGAIGNLSQNKSDFFPLYRGSTNY
ncbi:MAG: GNAT family N-acetyltransferase [Pyrinomonadaceae bacterium]|nr:GNAT family N-acetyltransferase [Sphingobacteriaceae bacterium]